MVSPQAPANSWIYIQLFYAYIIVEYVLNCQEVFFGFFCLLCFSCWYKVVWNPEILIKKQHFPIPQAETCRLIMKMLFYSEKTISFYNEVWKHVVNIFKSAVFYNICPPTNPLYGWNWKQRCKKSYNGWIIQPLQTKPRIPLSAWTWDAHRRECRFFGSFCGVRLHT